MQQILTDLKAKEEVKEFIVENSPDQTLSGKDLQYRDLRGIITEKSTKDYKEFNEKDATVVNAECQDLKFNLRDFKGKQQNDSNSECLFKR